MIKRIYLNESKFKNIFEAEADEKDDKNDGVTITVAPRKNRGTDYTDDGEDGTNKIDIKPHSRRGEDYTNYEDDDDDTVDEPATDEPQDNVSDDGEKNPYNDAPVEDAPPEEDSGDDDTGDMSDEAEDYTDDGEEETSDTEDEPEETEDNGTEQQQSDNDTNSSLKKYNLYKKYITLYHKIDSFINTLNNITVDNAEYNIIIKNVANNLREVEDMVYEYMTVKYQNTTYIQDMVFYESAITIVQLNLELIKNNKIKLKQ